LQQLLTLTPPERQMHLLATARALRHKGTVLQRGHYWDFQMLRLWLPWIHSTLLAKRTTCFNFQRSGLLDDDPDLQCMDSRILDALHNDLQRDKLREQNRGISGQPLSHSLHQVDGVAHALLSHTQELTKTLRMLYKCGLLTEDVFSDQSRYLRNRISELSQLPQLCQPKTQIHKGMSGQDLRHRLQSVSGVCTSLVRGTLHLRHTIEVLKLSGFVTDDEAEEHTADLDRHVATFKKLETSLPQRSELGRRCNSLPRLCRQSR